MRSEPEEKTDALAHAVIGAAIEVHRVLGPGFLEDVYSKALAIEFGLRGIPFEAQKTIHVNYKDHAVGDDRLDFVVGGRVVVELKAVTVFAPIHSAQLLSYLKATGLPLGLLINFNAILLKEGIRRMVQSSPADF